MILRRIGGELVWLEDLLWRSELTPEPTVLAATGDVEALVYAGATDCAVRLKVAAGVETVPNVTFARRPALSNAF